MRMTGIKNQVCMSCGELVQDVSHSRANRFSPAPPTPEPEWKEINWDDDEDGHHEIVWLGPEYD